LSNNLQTVSDKNVTMCRIDMSNCYNYKKMGCALHYTETTNIFMKFQREWLISWAKNVAICNIFWWTIQSIL